MSADGTEGGDAGPGTREVAYRLFATEFDDATLSYSESDEERAPNYVVTPTGLRVNRLFAVGVLTEVERLNTDTLRGRIVDPTGAFVTYAGQYQPEAQAFLDGAAAPEFVAITGKARTFEPDDADQIFTSVRPESLSEVTADTRDRWTVSAAEATLDRIAVVAAALDSALRGDELRDALAAAGVDESLAAGIPRAIDHYGTTTAYLEAVRRCAVDALEVVADERDEVRPIELTPGAGGSATLGPLPEVSLSLSHPDGETGTTADTSPSATPADTESTVETESTADTATAADTAPTTDTESPADTVSTTDTESSANTESSPAEQPADETTASDDPPTDATAAVDETTTADAAASTDAAAEPTESDTTAGSAAQETATPTAADAMETDDTDTTAPTADPEPASSATETQATATAESDEPAADDEPELYQLDPDEREELESEFGADFFSGNEVDPAGEADIDVPDADALAADAEAAAAGDAASADTPPADATSTDATASSGTLGSFEDTVDGDSDDSADATTGADDTATADDGTTAAADIDLEDAAVDVMAELDDGDGADREAVVTSVVEEHGVASAAVEDAIDDALMGGRCYEPDDDTLKPI